MYWAGLPPAVLGPNILSKGVETGPIATQFGPACAQTMSRLPGARLRQAECGAYPLFLPQKELFSSFYHGLNFLQFLPQDCLFSSFCCRMNFSSIFAAGLTFLQFLPQKELFSSFCHRRNFSPVFAAGLTFLLCSKTFLLCNKASYCAVKLSAAY